MKLDLSKLFDNPGEQQRFSAQLELGDVMRWRKPVFTSPVQVDGLAENRSGIVNVDYSADFILQAVCDRCLTELRQSRQMKFSHTVVLSLNREDNDEFIVVPDGKLDLAELATSDILLELPTLTVCDEGCKGLCPICGKNLNEGECTCVRQTGDSRFDKLRELLSD